MIGHKKGLSLVGIEGAPKKPSIEIEVSMFGAPTTMVLQVSGLDGFTDVLDALETQGYIDAWHPKACKQIRAYKYPGMIILHNGTVSNIIHPGDH